MGSSKQSSKSDNQDNVKLEFIVVTGFSGAGKSTTLEFLEDMGFYCVDNIPPELIPNFYDFCLSSQDDSKKRIALVTDIRNSKGNFDNLFDALESLKKHNYEYKILFLETQNGVLMQRYRLTRRKHPFIDICHGSVEEAIDLERSSLKSLRLASDYIVDTSLLLPSQLKERISNLFLKESKSALTVSCMSFGFRYGVPTEANLVFDVRCFKNPYYNDKLRDLTGTDEKIKKFVLENDDTRAFVQKVFSLVDFALPLYMREGKSQLVIAIGCTGGRHRSVAISNLLNDHLKGLGYTCEVSHRDIQKK